MISQIWIRIIIIRFRKIRFHRFVLLPAAILLHHYPVQLVVVGDCQFLRAVLSPPVEVEVAVGRAAEAAALALPWLELLVHRPPMMLELGRNEEEFATSITGEGFVSHVDHLDVNIQVVFVIETLATVRTHKCDSAVVLLIMQVKLAPESEHSVTLITEEGSLPVTVHFVLVTFQLIGALKCLLTFLAVKSV